jgi:hypothetical protein
VSIISVTYQGVIHPKRLVVGEADLVVTQKQEFAELTGIKNVESVFIFLA